MKMINYRKKALILECGICKDVIQSQYRNHFAACQCGETFTDGGDDYARFSAGENTIVLKEFGETREIDYEF